MKKIDKLVYKLIFFILKFLGKISIENSIKLCSFLGNIICYFDNRHRKVAFENLRHAYKFDMSDKKIKDIVTKVYVNLCRSIFEVGWLLTSRKKDIDEKIIVEGVDNFVKVLSEGRGVLIISGHIGAWELLPYVIAKLGFIVNIIYRPLDFKPLDKIMEFLRSKHGGHLIPAKGAMPSIIDALDRGEAVGLLIDQSADWYNGVWVDFFGHRTCTSKGPASIALKTKTPVIPVFVLREKYKFRVTFKSRVPLITTGDNIKDIEINTLNYTKIIEREIRNHSNQWFWVHRRWKNKAYSFWPRILNTYL